MPETDLQSPAPTQLDADSANIRSRADAVGAGLAESFTELLRRIPGAPLGPKRLGNRYDMTVGTASRFLRAVAEPHPIDLLRGVPGPAPLRRFLKAVEREGVGVRPVRRAERAVAAFEELIGELGGTRRQLNAVLSNWQPKSRREFVLGRRQAGFKALAELKGVSSRLTTTCIALNLSAQEGRLDALSVASAIGIARTSETAQAYFGTIRHDAEGDGPTPPLPETLDGRSSSDSLSDYRLDEFCAGPPLPIETTRIGAEVIHQLGHTPIDPGFRSDLIVAEVHRGAVPRRGEGYSSKPLGAYSIPTIPTERLNLDLLVHEDCLPGGRAELLVYSIVPRGPVVPGDPARVLDLEPVPETLEIHADGLDSLHLSDCPRYVESLEHSFGMIGWDPRRFCSWRVQADFPLFSSQYCILLGRR